MNRRYKFFAAIEGQGDTFACWWPYIFIDSRTLFVEHLIAFRITEWKCMERGIYGYINPTWGIHVGNAITYTFARTESYNVIFFLSCRSNSMLLHRKYGKFMQIKWRRKKISIFGKWTTIFACDSWLFSMWCGFQPFPWPGQGFLAHAPASTVFHANRWFYAVANRDKVYIGVVDARQRIILHYFLSS